MVWIMIVSSQQRHFLGSSIEMATILIFCARNSRQTLNVVLAVAAAVDAAAAPIRLRWHSHNENYSRRWRRQAKIYLPFQIMKYRHFTSVRIDVKLLHATSTATRIAVIACPLSLSSSHVAFAFFTHFFLSLHFFLIRLFSLSLARSLHFIISCRKMTFYE